MRFQIKTLIFVTTVAAILIAWYLDHERLKREVMTATESARVSASALATEREGYQRLRALQRENWNREMQRIENNYDQSIHRILEQISSRSADQRPAKPEVE